MPKRHKPELVELCRKFYLKGWKVTEISKETGVDQRTLYNWIERYKWKETAVVDGIEIAISKRIVALASRENKTEAELKEFSTLNNELIKLRYETKRLETLTSGAWLGEGFSNAPIPTEKEQPSKPKKQRQSKKKTVKNDISHITAEKLDEVRGIFFEYQELWYKIKNDPKQNRTRFILKSRQVGATFYFAFEALDDAIRTGDNQIFLSASRDQAEVFKAYIIAFAAEHLDVELKGQRVITLSNGAELRFLSTNSSTAQSYHGHLYLDEVFWIPNFEKMWKVASGMAAHKKWRRTLFSTPSAMSHQAYPLWSGDKFNKGRSEKNKVEFDISHKALKNGRLGEDKIWRHIVTVKDAEKQGCDLFDIDELKTDYNKDDFANLFMCKFVDDAKSIFSLNTLMACMIDELPVSFNEKLARPFGNRPVAVGYDPSRTRDNATLTILAVPLQPQDEWVVLKTMNFHGQNFQFQAARIKEVTQMYNVVHIGIDTTGIGLGVFELVEQFYPSAMPIHYSNERKTQLVLKAIDLIENNRFKYLAGEKNITQAFLMISKTTTGSGLITYSANRNSEAGHADPAWSIMHGLAYEELTPTQSTTVAFGQAA